MIGQTFNAQDFTQKLKATIQRTGRLGFTAETISTLQLNTGTYARLAPDTEDKNTYYMAVVREEIEDGFKICKSGEYVFLQTKQLFEKLGIDFKKWNIMYDMSRYEEGDEVMGGECYVMNARRTERGKEVKGER